MMDKVVLGRLALDIPVSVQVGKNGISDALLKELGILLKKRKLIKVRLLRSFLGTSEKKETIEHLATVTQSQVVFARGNTFALYREKL
ncbi:MAG: hypothetical protein QS99_C0004G0011 [archaeon GW2011_AR4]|nr:MAG: hypothetical protein QS99_C0004G0011 [archaeon GW2011_AR4]